MNNRDSQKLSERLWVLITMCLAFFAADVLLLIGFFWADTYGFTFERLIPYLPPLLVIDALPLPLAVFTGKRLDHTKLRQICMLAMIALLFISLLFFLDVLFNGGNTHYGVISSGRASSTAKTLHVLSNILFFCSPLLTSVLAYAFSCLMVFNEEEPADDDEAYFFDEEEADDTEQVTDDSTTDDNTD